MDVKTLLQKEKYKFDDLCAIMEILRSENGCPWDREQDHKSIRNNLLEETYEAVEGIDNGDSEILKEELGDVLLQVVFHARIAQVENDFDIDAVADGVCKKLILRHPHVFGTVEVEDSEEVLRNWDAIKRTEKSQATYYDTLDSVPRAFPALMRSSKVQKRAAKAGFDWDEKSDVFSKLDEEVAELKEADSTGDKEQIFEEFGDLLFAAVNLSRFLKVNAEEALVFATDKFMRRFKSVEEEVLASGRDMKELSLAELDSIWDKVKLKEKN